MMEEIIPFKGIVCPKMKKVNVVRMTIYLWVNICFLKLIIYSSCMSSADAILPRIYKWSTV